MKEALLILACCCSVLDVVNAATTENSNVTVVSDTQEAVCQSLPNSTGEVVFLKYDDNAKGYILYMKKNDGAIIKLFSYGAGIVPVTPPVTEEILWLNDNYFACVCSGRQNSFYAIYEIAREEPDNTMHSTCVYQRAEGRFMFLINWHVEDGILKALSRYGKIISEIKTL